MTATDYTLTLFLKKKEGRGEGRDIEKFARLLSMLKNRWKKQSAARDGWENERGESRSLIPVHQRYTDHNMWAKSRDDRVEHQRVLSHDVFFTPAIIRRIRAQNYSRPVL